MQRQVPNLEGSLSVNPHEIAESRREFLKRFGITSPGIQADNSGGCNGVPLGRRRFIKHTIVGTVATAGVLTPEFEQYLGLVLQGTASLLPTGCALIPKTTTIDDLVMVSYPQSIPQESIEPFLRETKKAYETIVNFLGVVPSKVFVTVSDERTFTSRREGYKINYSKSQLAGKNHPEIWHELVHSLTMSGTDFYPEALAEYIQFRFGNRRNKDAHSWANRKFKQYGRNVSVLEIIYEPIGSIDWRGPEIRKHVNYSVAASFARYLIEDVLKGDIKRFMEFFNANDTSDENHKKFFGKTLKELEADWMVMLNKYGDRPKIFRSY